MFALSIAHVFAFEYWSYAEKMIAVRLEEGDPERVMPVLRNFASTVSQRDMVDSVKESYIDRAAGKNSRKKESAIKLEKSLRDGYEILKGDDTNEDLYFDLE